MHKVYFLLGGARSGKSFYAEELASSISSQVAYLATARVTDKEMEKRIEAHKKRRPRGWKTIELGDSIEQKDLEQLDIKGCEVLIVDCVTNLLYRFLERYRLDELDIIPNDLEQKIEGEVSQLFESFYKFLQSADATIIIVSNEVGMGLVPPYPLGRIFRDLMGTVNKQLALLSDEAYFFIAGIRRRLK
ncbi:MAG: bifunctional adenosylcobinamide kinase/adenosylcobinamide-phosphate guanylyltransferase [Actinomycetia bacterium]|nr:bifunctional adenosylcobinamide kinase/adenosylcobinamide-phosphate guanylyltransferase [Actinomycetes bacterium]